MLIRGNGEGEVSGDLDLRLLSAIASRMNIGVVYTPPGTNNIRKPITSHIHQCLPSPCLDEFSSLLGIRVLEWGLGNKAYSTIGACAILAIVSTDALLSNVASITIGLSWPSITVTLPFLLTSSRNCTM